MTTNVFDYFAANSNSGKIELYQYLVRVRSTHSPFRAKSLTLKPAFAQDQALARQPLRTAKDQAD
jgi:hypothetical protein